MMKKAIILTRISTQKQKTDRQPLELESYCLDRGYEIVRTISSIVSGRKVDKRPDLDEILQLAKQKAFDVLVVTEISRISRRPEVLQAFISSLRKCGIPILFKNLNLMSMDEVGKESFATNVIISIFGELAAEETRQLSERVVSGLQAARARGKILGRIPGQESTDDILKKHAKVARYLKSGQTLPETAKLANVSYNTVKKVKSVLQQSA
jgi:DNA invertase Pin-like site-specific DNA recombinase